MNFQSLSFPSETIFFFKLPFQVSVTNRLKCNIMRKTLKGPPFATTVNYKRIFLNNELIFKVFRCVQYVLSEIFMKYVLRCLIPYTLQCSIPIKSERKVHGLTWIIYSSEFFMSGPTHSEIRISLLYERSWAICAIQSKLDASHPGLRMGQPPNLSRRSISGFSARSAKTSVHKNIRDREKVLS